MGAGQILCGILPLASHQLVWFFLLILIQRVKYLDFHSPPLWIASVILDINERNEPSKLTS